MRTAASRGFGHLPAVLGRHGLHLGQPGLARLSRRAPGLDRRRRRRSDARHHLQVHAHPAEEVKFRSLLVANRGEIALRVMRTARRMGLRTISVYSDADRDAPHVRAADAAFHIGGSSPRESYLNISSVLKAEGEAV